MMFAVSRLITTIAITTVLLFSCETPEKPKVQHDDVFFTESIEWSITSAPRKAITKTTTTGYAVLAGRFTTYVFEARVKADLPKGAQAVIVTDATNQLSIRTSKRNEIEIDVNARRIRITEITDKKRYLTNPNGDGWVEDDQILEGENKITIERTADTLSVRVNEGNPHTVSATRRREGFIAMGLNNETGKTAEVAFAGWRCY